MVKSFLKSSKSILLIKEDESQKAHALAVAHCLLFSQQVLMTSSHERDPMHTVIRGLLGFHMYATEFWLDYLLEYLKFGYGLLLREQFFTLSCHIADNFESMESGMGFAENIPPDPRLHVIYHSHPSLYRMARVVLSEQSKVLLETVLVKGIALSLQLQIR